MTKKCVCVCKGGRGMLSGVNRPKMGRVCVCLWRDSSFQNSRAKKKKMISI